MGDSDSHHHKNNNNHKHHHNSNKAGDVVGEPHSAGMPHFVEERSDFIDIEASEHQPSYDRDPTCEEHGIENGSDISSELRCKERNQEKQRKESVASKYVGVENVHTFETMEEANQMIGGSTIATGDQKKKNKRTHYITIEDIDDDETKELKKYQNYNKDHKVFSFSLPFGQNNNSETDLSPISKIKTMLPESTITKTKAKLGNEEVDESVEDIKQKFERQNSINSLEELILFKDEKGITGARSAALKKVFAMDELKHRVKEMTVDDTETTSDGYLCKRIDSIWNELEGDVVILGGYRGSKLLDKKTGKRLWIPIKAGFNLDDIDLFIGPEDEDEYKIQEKVTSHGMLTHVGPVDVSRHLIRKLLDNPKVEVKQFGYDWRLSLDISAEKLKHVLQRIYDRQKTKKGIYIIAHSMGGLVAHKVLQEYTHLIRGIVYIGSPSQCSNVLGPIRFGDEVVFNRDLLSKENNFFMRSSFIFLPFDGRCFIDKNTFERYDLDFFDPKVWIKLGLSPLVSEKRREIVEKKKGHKHINHSSTSPILPSSNLPKVPVLRSIHTTAKFMVKNAPILGKITHGKDAVETYEEVAMVDDSEFKTPYEDCVEYLERTLQRTKKYLESLEYIPDKEYPPLAIVYGNKVPTVRGCKVDGIQGIRDGQYSDFYYGPGDGVVHYKWLLPEQRGFPVVAKVASAAGHVSLMTDLAAVAKAFISIVDAEKERS